MPVVGRCYFLLAFLPALVSSRVDWRGDQSVPVLSGVPVWRGPRLGALVRLARAALALEPFRPADLPSGVQGCRQGLSRIIFSRT